MDKAPAFQFYPSDWLDVKVLRMSLSAQGAYIRWLCHMWRDSGDQCSIENSVSVLSRLVGISEDECTSILREIQWPNDPIFDEKNGRLVSRRLQRIRKEQDAYRKTRSDAGKRGMERRWGSNNPVIAPPITKDNSSSSSSSSPSSSSSKDEDKDIAAPAAPLASEIAEELVSLWNAGKANKEWIRVTKKRITKTASRLKDGFTREQLRTAVANCRKSEWHQGANDSGWKAPGPEWVLHNIEKVEQWINKESGNGNGKKAIGPRATGTFSLAPGELDNRLEA